MKRHTTLLCLASLLTLTIGAATAQPPAPAPSFTISAPNITMPSSGTATVNFTLTSVDGFTGTVAVNCAAPTVSANVILPYIDLGGPLHAYTVTANAATTGNFNLLATPPLAVPAALNHPARRSTLVWSLAGVFLLGLGLRRRKSLRYTHLLLAVGLLIGVSGITACAGPETLTPGTYTYTLTATQVDVPAIPSATATTTFTVTVPRGIVTHRKSGE
jgi:hypothetical protein